MPGLVPPVADERDGLLAYLAQQRHVLRVAAYGLTEEQARATPSASALSIAALVKHVTVTERAWIDRVLRRESPGGENRYGESFEVGPGDTLAGLLADLDEAAKETEAVVADIADLGQEVPVPPGVPWFPADVKAWSVRWVLLHLIEETARHAGHADIVRESIDGATAFALMAGLEGWEPTPWLQPWSPPTT
jgi:uncharacterized damage-inducible protein DinB